MDILPSNAPLTQYQRDELTQFASALGDVAPDRSNLGYEIRNVFTNSQKPLVNEYENKLADVYYAATHGPGMGGQSADFQSLLQLQREAFDFGEQSLGLSQSDAVAQVVAASGYTQGGENDGSVSRPPSSISDALRQNSLTPSSSNVSDTLNDVWNLNHAKYVRRVKHAISQLGNNGYDAGAFK